MSSNPNGDEKRSRLRTRDPERAREAILEAALVEFGAHGFAGARTAAIAERAGLSTQLITHHFGGKQGVLDELRRRWKETGAAQTEPDQRYRGSVSAHMRAVLSNPDWSKLVLWHALEGIPGASERDDFTGRMGDVTARIAQRQESGELTERVEPEFIALLGYLLAFAPLSLPDHLRGLTGRDPLAPEYQEWASDQLTKLLATSTRRSDVE